VTASEGETILVVENERSIADATVARLRAEGFRALLAADGPSAVERAAATDPDLIILDLADGAVLSRGQLIDQVWGHHDASAARTVDSHVGSIRRQTADGMIRTVHSVGYTLGDIDGPPGGTNDGAAAR